MITIHPSPSPNHQQSKLLAVVQICQVPPAFSESAPRLFRVWRRRFLNSKIINHITEDLPLRIIVVVVVARHRLYIWLDNKTSKTRLSEHSTSPYGFGHWPKVTNIKSFERTFLSVPAHTPLTCATYPTASSSIFLGDNSSRV